MENILDVPIEKEMKDSYLDYAMSVIVGRALPDVRDGLKPVHRRILFTMYELSNTHDKPYKKSARVVGDCLGKFHPHGDIAIYDTLVRMAQPFSLRYLLVDGQGNFGCFTKDTKVRLADGRSLAFGELVNEHTQGKRNFTFTVDDGGRIKIAEITAPRLTIKNAELVKVILDNGEEIRCTPNHRFMLLDGTYREARSLRPRDSLMPLYTKLSDGRDDPNLAGYERIYQPVSDEWQYSHHISDEWNISHATYAKSNGIIRHHIDFNKLNNRPDNLRRMDWKEHWQLHYLLTSSSHKNDSEYRKKLAAGRTAYWNDENRSRQAKRMGKRNLANWKETSYREKMSSFLRGMNRAHILQHPELRKILSGRATKTLKRLWQDPEYRSFMHLKIIKGNKNRTTNQTGKLKFVRICKKLSERALVLCEENYEKIRNEIYPYGKATSWKTGIENYFGSRPELVLQELNGNHKVVRVETLREREDVYDLTIEGTHNFALAAGIFVHNSIDGDSAAAMRYTEVRMSRLAGEMLQDLEKETVAFTPNFDGTMKEPLVMPSKFPNLIINGSSGIAVGMATNVAPHNLGEVADALVAMIDGAGEDAVLNIVKGPDFPTGGIIVGKSGAYDSLKTGRGTLRVRGRCEVKKDSKGRDVISLTEIPYQVTKTAIIESIAEGVKNKRIEGISGIHDRSDKQGIEVIIDLKKDAIPEVVLNQLYAHTPLESTFGVINMVLVNNTPKMLGIYAILGHFLEFRKEIVTKRCQYELKVAEARAHILEGLKKALDNIDAVVAFLRGTKNVETARAGLMKKYSLSEEQANAILDMKLQRLIALEREKIDKEYEELMKTIIWLKDALADVNKILKIIKEELAEIRSKYADERRTEIIDAEGERTAEELIPDDEVVVTLTHRGYVKRVGLDEYRAQKRGGKGVVGTGTKEGDLVKDLLMTRNRDYLLCFTDKGRVYWLKAYGIPEAGRYAEGRPIVNMLQLQEKDEKVSSWVAVRQFSDTEYLSMITKNGIIKRTSLDSFSRPRSNGIIAITLKPGDELVEVVKTDGKQDLLVATKKGLSIRFNEQDAREIGRTGQGVIGIRFKEGEDVVVGIAVCRKPYVLTVTDNGYGKRTPLEEYRTQGRGGSGIINIKTEGRNGDVIGVKTVDDNDELMVMSSKGQVIRSPVSGISAIGRNTQGVRIIRLDEGEKVATFAVFRSEEKLVEQASAPPEAPEAPKPQG